MTNEKQSYSGRKCTCDHYEKQHHQKINPILEYPQSRSYLTAGEIWEDTLNVRGITRQWVPQNAGNVIVNNTNP